MRPPKTSDEALDLLVAMDSHYENLMDQFDEDDEFYDGDLEELIEAPEAFPITIPTTGRAIVDEAVDNIDPDDMIIKYPVRPGRGGDKPEQDADKVRRFLKALWIHWRHNQSDIDPLRDMAKNLFRSGKGVWKIVPDYTLWPSLSEEHLKAVRKEKGADGVKAEVKRIKALRRQSFPLTIRSLPLQSVMEDTTVSQRKLWVIEQYRISLDEVRNYYIEFAEELDTMWNDSGEFEVSEIWTATHADQDGNVQQGKHWVFVSRRMVVEEDNAYGFLPYIIRHAGFGREQYEGKPEKKAVGFYTLPVRSMLLAEARRATHFDAIMSQLAFPVAFVSHKINLKSFSLAPGTINPVPDSMLKDIQHLWVKAPIPNPEYLQSLDYIAGQIERGTTQRAIRGQNVPGTDSAAQLSMIQGQARLRLTPVTKALQSAVEEADRMVLEYIDDHLEDNVTIFTADEEGGSATIGPSNIRGHYFHTVTFVPNEEALKERKLILAMDAYTKGGFSRYDAYDYAGFENPWELIKRRDVDDLMNEPVIKRAMAKQMAKDLGIDVSELELMEQMEAAGIQVQLRDWSNALQAGTLRGGGGGVPNPSGDQTPQAAQAQFAPTLPGPPGAPPGTMDELGALTTEMRRLQGQTAGQ